MQNHIRINPGRINGQRFRPVPALGAHEVEIVIEPVARERVPDVVHEWGLQSFPASDPPANW